LIIDPAVVHHLDAELPYPRLALNETSVVLGSDGAGT